MTRRRIELRKTQVVSKEGEEKNLQRMAWRYQPFIHPDLLFYTQSFPAIVRRYPFAKSHRLLNLLHWPSDPSLAQPCDHDYTFFISKTFL
jgi:hypothetical protein